jgi:transcriptional regulator with XRE-family HTH domain
MIKILINLKDMISVVGFWRNAMDFDVGKRLRALREAQNLSQRQLADFSGVTNGMISMVEQNRTSPSVSSLKKILDGLGISISEFFAVDVAAENPIFFAREHLIEVTPHLPNGGEGGAFFQVGDASRHTLQMLHETYQPGADTGEELDAYEAEEAGIVVSGRIEVTVGDKQRELGPGDAYLFDSRLPHRFRNIGNVACVIISACTPPKF